MAVLLALLDLTFYALISAAESNPNSISIYLGTGITPLWIFLKFVEFRHDVFDRSTSRML